MRFRSAPNMMTLDDFKHKNMACNDFLAISGYDTYFKSKLPRNH